MTKALTALTAAALLTAGCGGGGDTASTGSSTSGSATATTPSGTAAPELTDQQEAPARLNIDVTIKGGQVTPTNEQFETRVNQPIVVRVNSDTADELHVHSNPEHSFTIEPKSGQAFQFTVDVPGKVDVELHEANKTIATINVLQ